MKILQRASFAPFNACLALALFASGISPDITSAQAMADSNDRESMECAPVGRWVVPGAGKVPGAEIITRAAEQSVVLLGEMHDNAEHHRWQLQTLAALHMVRPDMVIGFEMFPRRVQKTLDQWVAGELTEAQFLAASDWNTVWSTDAALYMPLFHFARMNRIPMVALNIDTRLRRAVGAKGFGGVPENEREGVTPPAAPSTAYLGYLLPIYDQHARDGKKNKVPRENDPDFLRFVETQQLWDRAMAQAIHSALDRPGAPLVVGIMGSGHIKHGYGVPDQLKDLRITDVAGLLPWNSGTACDQITEGIADAIFGIASLSPVSHEPPPQRLGIRFEVLEDGGVRVLQVEKGSVAETAGIREGDVIGEAAGVPIKRSSDIGEIVKRQAPGTWLPLKLRRGGDTIDIVAKFPAIQK